MPDNRRTHPSGKPNRKEDKRSRPLWRIPDDGYVTPRLKRDDKPQAIGFVHRFPEERD